MDLPFHKALILGAIAATSAFIVTILIVLVCVGCQRDGRRRRGRGKERESDREENVLRQCKLNSMSKSDTRLHEMQRMSCNANGE
uniref:Uncharacterized protein n=1 Tax=Electrophorus electricus TaxID=8005 RepID=A0A4W4HPJ5_ELEEL